MAFFYYVFKFEQTPTYYARLDVVVLREFYPTFDSITIFAELPLGQGIFFLVLFKIEKDLVKFFFTNQYIYMYLLYLVVLVVTCILQRVKKIQFPIYLWPAKIV